MWSNLSSSVNSSLSTMSSMAKKLTEETEVISQMEKTAADRDHFRALATQADARRAELEFELRARESTIEELRAKQDDTQRKHDDQTTRLPGDGRDDSDVKRDDELSRLRQHLVAVEDDYTRELLDAQQREERLQERCQQLEAELRRLRNTDSQIRTLAAERDQARNEVSALEDRLQTYSASVANLQVVIEQIQRENDRKVAALEREHERELEVERGKTREALEWVRAQERRQETTFEALGAASRLSESLDAKEALVTALKLAANRKDVIIEEQEARIRQLIRESDSKVDKQALKGLVVGLLLQHDQRRRQDVQRLLARILDFNAEEMQQCNIQIGKLKPEDSLSHQFVHFLESESARDTAKVDREWARDLSKSLIVGAQKPFESRRSSMSRSSSDNLLLTETPLCGFPPVVISKPDVL